uniref:Alpha/beta hydrolase fold-3 domain-containing protein n=1 Tax=Ananas comosus var. bracteatus TaxID=296719 RepID=A0A6V7PE64_ANACO|nr:unnamed protein product [Ananas comosus var. bracteatus]
MAGSNEVNANESKMVVPLNTWVLISNFKVAYNMLRRPDGTFDRHLAEFLDRRVPANALPTNGVVSFDLLIDRPTNLLARIYRPAPIQIPIPIPIPIPMMIMILLPPCWPPPLRCSPTSTDRRPPTLSPSSSSSTAAASRTPPPTPPSTTPSAAASSRSAMPWAASEPWLHSGKDAELRVFLCGDSSGGNIAHHVAARAGEAGIRISGNILLNAMFGGNRRTESEQRLDGKYFVTVQDRDWYWKAYLPEGADRDHPACNVFGPSSVRLDRLPFPKSLVIVSGLDLTSDWQLAYAQGLRDAGHHVKLVYREQATVGFYLLPNTDHFYEVMEEIKNFVGSNC